MNYTNTGLIIVNIESFFCYVPKKDTILEWSVMGQSLSLNAWTSCRSRTRILQWNTHKLQMQSP